MTLVAYANLFGFTGTAINLFWPLFKKRNSMLVYQAVACVLFIIHYWLLDAKTGALMALVSGIQALLAIPLEKKPDFKKIYLATIPLVFILALVTWNGLPSVFSSVAMAILSYARLQIDVKRFRFFLSLSIAFWFSHNLIVFSLPGMTSDLMTLFSNLWMYRKLTQSQGNGASN